uniref:Pentacotripeptide-repeat region of PRORP domain-containing protein n=1 Tax=Oryza meridionalis TaxID=40149 RepID=A0A0E0E3I5_9ORYZ
MPPLLVYARRRRRCTALSFSTAKTTTVPLAHHTVTSTPRRLRFAAALSCDVPTNLYITPNLVYRLPQHPAFLLKGLVGIGDLDAALKVLDGMTGLGIALDAVTYTTVLAVHCGKGPDATMHTLLIGSYCQCGMLQHAAKIMDVARLQPNEVTKSAEARK